MPQHAWAEPLGLSPPPRCLLLQDGSALDTWEFKGVMRQMGQKLTDCKLPWPWWTCHDQCFHSNQSSVLSCPGAEQSIHSQLEGGS